MNMSCEIPGWIIPAFLWVAPLSIVFSLDVMQRTGHDEINQKDPQWIQWLRRLGFIMMASNLGSAMYFAWTSQITMFVIFMFFLVLSGTYSLFINDIALRLRPSMPGGGTRAYAGRFSPAFIAATLRKIRDDLERLDRGQMGLDRGQLLTHEYLQAILLHLEQEVDPVAVEPTVIFPTKWRKPS